MKKIILAIISIVCLNLNAQTFEIEYNGKLLNDGDVVKISSAENILGDWKMKFKFNVTNISSASYSMRMKKEVISEAPNSSNTMCWDQCMSPSDIYALCSSIAPGETNSTAYGELWANCDGDAVNGTTIVNYTFMTSNKTDPQINVEVHYIFDPNNPSGVINEKTDKLITVSSFDGAIVITSSVEKTIYIHDSAGRLVKTANIIKGENFVHGLSKGLYIVENKKVIL